EEDSMFEAWGGGIRELCERGFMHYVVQEKKAYIASPEFEPIPEEEAKLEIARRYFTNMGPATIHDAMYYTGAKQAEVKNWLNQLPVESVECEGKTYYYIPNGKSYDNEIPPCIFLAGFDQLMLGYQKKESIYLPQEHLRGIFNLAGIVMPPILLNGKVVGKWKKKDSKLWITLFEALAAKDRKIIQRTAECFWHCELKITFD
ncbi:MAG: winged helix DNA-binding domain-containing protein, partial [Clostridia bacterium]|nr:winged helix DNA-binding domain-containing protein [Clostridia bacterium]